MFDKSWLSDEMITDLRALNEIAARRGQTLAQLARHGRYATSP